MTNEQLAILNDLWYQPIYNALVAAEQKMVARYNLPTAIAREHRSDPEAYACPFFDNSECETPEHWIETEIAADIHELKPVYDALARMSEHGYRLGTAAK